MPTTNYPYPKSYLNKFFYLKILCLLCIFLCLSACSKFKPYEPNIQQGNIFDATTVNKLHLGMPKSEVLNILGTPVLSHTFNPQKLHYIYTNQINGGTVTIKRLVLTFVNNKLISIQLVPKLNTLYCEQI
jgi:outer membrane protein assembly factor BamE